MREQAAVLLVVLITLFFSAACASGGDEGEVHAGYDTSGPEVTDAGTGDGFTRPADQRGEAEALEERIDAAPDSLAPVFPMGLHDSSQVELTESGEVSIAGAAWRWNYYSNPAYECGRTGVFTFLVMERAEDVAAERPLWVFLRGGGVGFYDGDGVYVGDEPANDEMDAQALLGSLVGPATGAGGELLETVTANRFAEGWRLAAVSMCDHDLHSGFGTPYLNNPHHGEAGDTVDGLLANLAAMDFIMNGYDTGATILHGTSAGSAGAWSLAFALWQHGIQVTGAILDSYTWTARMKSLYGRGCSLAESIPGFDIEQVILKIGLMLDQEAFFVERQVEAGFPVPLFDVISDHDYHCCGLVPPVEEAVEAGFETNCDWAHSSLFEAMETHPEIPHGHLVVPDSLLHVLTLDEGPAHAPLEAWLQSIL